MLNRENELPAVDKPGEIFVAILRSYSSPEVNQTGGVVRDGLVGPGSVVELGCFHPGFWLIL